MSALAPTDVLAELDFHPPCELEEAKREAYCHHDGEHPATWWIKVQCNHDFLICDGALAVIQRMLADGGGPDCPTEGCSQYFTAIMDSARFAGI